MNGKTLFLLCAVVAASCSTAMPANGKKPLNIPAAKVTAAARQCFRQIPDTAKVSDNDPYAISVKNIGAAISRAVDSYLRTNGMVAAADSLKWEFKLEKSNRVNAFCLPGGKLVVYQGIFPLAKDANGLAIIISHEMAHMLVKHYYPRLVRQIKPRGKASKITDTTVSKAMNAIYGLGTTMPPYTLKEEAEVDRLALVLMGMADFDPTNGILFWENVNKNPDKSVEYLRIHPTDAARVKRLNDMFQDVIQYFRYD